MRHSYRQCRDCRRRRPTPDPHDTPQFHRRSRNRCRGFHPSTRRPLTAVRSHRSRLQGRRYPPGGKPPMERTQPAQRPGRNLTDTRHDECTCCHHRIRCCPRLLCDWDRSPERTNPQCRNSRRRGPERAQRCSAQRDRSSRYRCTGQRLRRSSSRSGRQYGQRRLPGHRCPPCTGWRRRVGGRSRSDKCQQGRRPHRRRNDLR